MIILRQKPYSVKNFSEILEEKLFRNKANREATRRWQMEQAVKAGPEGISGHSLYYTKQKGGINGVKSSYGWGSDHAFEMQKKGFESAGIDNSRLSGYRQQQRKMNLDPLAEKEKLSRTVVDGSSSSVFNTREAARDYMAETHHGKSGLKTKESVQQRVKNLSPERQAELARRKANRAAATHTPTPTPTPPPVTPTPTPKTPTTTLTQNVSGKSKSLLSGMSKGTKAALIGTAVLGTGAAIYGLSKKDKRD